MNELPQALLFVGIIPALALVYLIIRKWTGQFQEKLVFLLFVFGIISGFTIIFVEFYIGFTTLIEYVIIFRFIEIMGKTIILNIPRFQEKQHTVLYGLVLGLGFGSIYPPVSLLLVNSIDVSLVHVISILVGSLGMLLIQGSTGAFIGFGVFKRKLLIFLTGSLVIQIVIQYLLFSLPLSWTWILIIAGILLYSIVMKKIVLPVSSQTERRKRVLKNNKTSDQ